ncbi:MAG: helix-turn-helix transcriptional regulator [Sphingomonadaceae bacterium]|nr:helix-turn-helix transcriptional regulator [Sphingomonadaceae bacterium]
MSAGEKLKQVGERLRAERLRFEASLDSFAETVGIHRNSLSNYENGDRAMNATLLLVLDDLGVDICYVLTGKRSDGSLDPMTSSLIDGFLRLSEREKHAVLLLVASLAGTEFVADEFRPKSRPTLHSPALEFKPQPEET